MRIRDWSSDVCAADLPDPAAHRQTADVVTLDRLQIAEPLDDRAEHVGLEGRRLVGQAHPHIAEPLPYMDVDQAVRGPVDVRPLSSERRRVGKECVSMFRNGWLPCPKKQKKNTQ